MRNLKRALSLALASVMLMGMMVVGSSASAKSFTDADKIDNKEAVAITSGLGIFDGRDDGSFGADDVVTRAEAAVVIAKILHGADVDPSNFVGTTKFTDVPAWAEGWVNLAASLNIIVGYGDGKFGPNDPVTTVQFTTMLLKALGYYTFDGALDADWQLTVTSKATALGLYGDLVLPMNEGLTRENVAQLVWNTMLAQRVAFDDYRGLYVAAADRDVVVVNGTDVPGNTIAEQVFGLMDYTSVIVSNDAIDVNADGWTTFYDVDENGVYDPVSFEVETGLDMIGHEATVYFTYDEKDKEIIVYAVVDEATLAVETVMTKNLTTLAKNNGFRNDTSVTEVYKNYDLFNELEEATNKIHETFSNCPVIMISNSADKTLDLVIVLKQTLDYIADIDVDDTDEDEIITTYEGDVAEYNDAEDAVVVGEVEKGDYVIVTDVNNGTKIIEAAKTEFAIIDEIDRSKSSTTKLYSNGTGYAKNSKVDAKDLIDAGKTEFTIYADVSIEGEYVLVYDTEDRLIGVTPVEEDEVVNAAYVAQFGYKINTLPSLNDDYLMTVHVYFADGTDGIYFVDNTDGLYEDVEVKADGSLIGTEIPDVDALNAEATLGLFDVTVNSDKTVTIETLEAPASNPVTKIKNRLTYMGEDLYANSKTLFWMVYGTYADTWFEVDTIVGVNNVPTVDVVDVEDVIVTAKTGYELIDTMIIKGYKDDSTIDGVYYYAGKYTIKKIAADEFTLTYKLYDVTTGEAATLTYEFDTYAKAKDEAVKVAGFYEDNKDNMVAYTDDADYDYKTEQVLLDYVDLGDTMTMYVYTVNEDAQGVIINDETIFVDLTSNKLEDLDDVDNLVEKIQKTWDKALENGYILEPKTVEAKLSYVCDDEDTIAKIVFVAEITEGKYTKDYADK